MGIEVVVVALSLFTIAIQFAAWVWAHRLVRRLRGEEGYEFVRLVEWVIAGITIARLVGLLGAIALGWTSMTLDNALILTTMTQFLTAFVLVEAVRRVRGFSRETPVDGSGEAVTEPGAEPTAEVPDTTGHIWSTVDHRDGHNSTSPAELD